MIGSTFFIGVICSIVMIPKLADNYGRVQQIQLAIFLQCITQAGMLWTKSLYQAYFFMFLLGLTFPGKNIIWYNYILEITKDEWRNTLVNVVFLVECSSIVWISLYYQTISRSWLYLQIYAFVIIILVLMLVLCSFYESPKYLYTKKKFD